MVDLPDGGPAFDVRAYIRSQPARTQWLVAQCPRAHSFTQQMLAGQASAHPDRTLKSYILQEAESVSRGAKVAWAEKIGADWISLQHDGVVIALPSAG